MKIVIVSDSHCNNEALRYAIRQEQPFDLLIHAGDVQGNIDAILPVRFREYEVVCVRGNCDYGTSYPAEDLIPIRGEGWQRNIYVCHGHGYSVRRDDSLLLEAARRQLADVVIYGHTHMPVCYETADNILVINPGSVSEPRQADRKRSYAILQFDEGGEPAAAIKYIPGHIG